LARHVLWPARMTTLLLDPTLRRARIVRITVAALLTIAVATAALCAAALRGVPRSAPSLPLALRGSNSAGRRPVCGQRPVTGQRTLARSRRSRRRRATEITRVFVPPKVTAFVDPSVSGALDSLRAHARQIETAAMTGLFIDEDGGLLDRIDRDALAVARDAHVRTVLLVQNIDERDGRWRPDGVRRLERDRGARDRFASALATLARDAQVAGVHLDLEDLGETWTELPPLVGEIARELRRRGLAVAVDVPSGLDPEILRQLAGVADGVVVMAYDEHDADAEPGAIASDDYVEATLRQAAADVPIDKLTAGLAIYGYDWVDAAPAGPLSFVEAHAAAKHARADVRWDASGNARFGYTDAEGRHVVWMTDAATVWNQARLAADAGIGTVALWRLGGEDPGIWQALAGADSSALATVAADPRVINEGEGPFLALASSPGAGRRRLRLEADRVADERWIVSPSPYVVRHAGIIAGEVALTFDDGPDPRFTPQILEVLAREHVPATFFVIGSQAARAPELVRRTFDAGHTIGNHSFTHPNIDAVSDLRLRTELEGTSRLVESIIGRRPLLYRPPALADIEPRTASGAIAFARAGSLGYLVVDATIDPRDWEQRSSERIVGDTLAQAGHGGVILLHDGGGDRTATVRALPEIIAGLRARGLRFVPLAALVGKGRDEVMPPVRSEADLGTAVSRFALRGGLVAIGLFRATLAIALGLIALRALLLIAAALAGERRRRRTRPRGPLPSVTALIPAFNEALVIERTIESVLASDVPVEVVVIDDGSTDGTAAVVAARYRRDPRVRLLRQPNGGKAAALRAGFAVCRTEAVVALDGDTLFAPATIRRLIEPMCDPRVGAVAGTAEVGNLENALGRWQALEYVVQQELERRAWSLIDAVPIVPGAVGAWRRRAVLHAGGFSSETLAEDADLAMTLCRGGWRVVHAPAARAWTEAPTTVRGVIKQRVRWSFGILQALWKHRRAVRERHGFGRVVWPTMALFQLVLPVLTPTALLALLAAGIAGNLQPAVVAATLFYGVEVLQFAIACALSRRGGGAGAWRLAPCLLTSRLLYRPLLLAVTLRSIGRILDGVPLGWGKLARRNTVVAYAAATHAVRSARSG
jgi:peptidoglycan/xylan/chitin deacetylase (PgdA/CDA1 family)/spore germination protein YaaH